MSANDGGPAFPQPDYCPKCAGQFDGMSPRDYFAGQALAGMAGEFAKVDSDVTWDGLAEDAYRLADAMLAARSEGRKDGAR